MRKYKHIAAGRTHMLIPNLKRVSRTKVALVGAEIYDRKNRYMGYWYVHNMPEAVKRRLLAHALEWLEQLSQSEKEWYFQASGSNTE